MIHITVTCSYPVNYLDYLLFCFTLHNKVVKVLV